MEGSAAGVCAHDRFHCTQVEEAFDLSPVDRLGQCFWAEDLGQVEQGSGAGGGRDSVDDRDLPGLEARAVCPDALDALFATHPSIDKRIAALVKFGGGRDPGAWDPDLLEAGLPARTAVPQTASTAVPYS